MLKDQILKIKIENPTWGYKKIAKFLNCAYSSVKYHLSNDKTKYYEKHKQYIKINPLCQKLCHFREIREKKKRFDSTTKKTGFYRRFKSKSLFTTKDLLIKFGENPTCYLTGKKINLDDIQSYEFDHKIPVCQNGDNSIENLGLCIRDANRAKADKTPEQFIELCKLVLLHYGYKIENPVV